MDTSKRDWGLVFGGIALVVVGFIIMVLPGLTLINIALITGAVCLVAGVFDLINYVRFHRQVSKSGWALVNALCNIVLGLVFLFNPIVTAAVIPWVAGCFVMAYSVVAIVTSLRIRVDGSGWGWMLASGIVGVICGATFFLVPDMFAIFLGLFLMMRGVTMAVLGASTPTVHTM